MTDDHDRLKTTTLVSYFSSFRKGSICHIEAKKREVEILINAATCLLQS